MNADQQRNIEESIKAIGEGIFRAWSYLHLLRGFQRGGLANPETLKAHALAVDVTYRALFDALFAIVGTVLDRTKSTYSIPSLIRMVRRYGVADPDVRRDLAKINAELTEQKSERLHKLEKWRHEVVAHRTPEGRAVEFYANNRLHFDEVEAVLAQLEEMVNRISMPLLQAGYHWRPGNDRCIREAESLLSR